MIGVRVAVAVAAAALLAGCGGGAEILDGDGNPVTFPTPTTATPTGGGTARHSTGPDVGATTDPVTGGDPVQEARYRTPIRPWKGRLIRVPGIGTGSDPDLTEPTCLALRTARGTYVLSSGVPGYQVRTDGIHRSADAETKLFRRVGDTVAVTGRVSRDKFPLCDRYFAISLRTVS